MEFNLRTTSLLLALVTVALSAGFFYGWNISAIPGLKRVTDRNYLESMQSINKAILNPWFFVIFFGPVVLMLLSSYTQFRINIDQVFWLILCATALYILGTIGITMFGNVPLNNMLEAADLNTLDTDGLRSLRAAFEEKWNSLNLIRAFFAVVSFILLLLALVRSKVILD